MRKRISYTSTSASSSLPMKVVKFLLGLVLLGVFLTIAFFLFIYLVIFAAAVFGYWWWKTRALRKSLREAAPSYTQQSHPAEDGLVIEGEVIRESVSPSKVNGAGLD
jgi:ABC-type bacteriocin/lantibiotic exporter with double-glycine peptidase domain